MILNVLEAGAGPPVCLLHGLFGRAQNFGLLARRLSARFRVLSVDLRNHGASPHGAGMGYAVQAADVLETLAAHQALPAAILGHSMGGKVAMMAALIAPDRCERLVVADIAPVAYAHHNTKVARALQALPLLAGLTRGAALAALADAVPDAAVRGFLLQNLTFAEVPAWKIGLDEIAAGMTDIEGWPDLPASARFEGPALFVSGGISDYVSPDSTGVIGGYFPAARFVSIPDAGHWLHADQPEMFGRAVEEFLLGAPNL